ncbi:MAG: PAS domain S-box protein [Desulfosudaceae bacterium]
MLTWKINQRIILLLLFDLVVGVALMVWVANRAEKDMRSELLIQAEIVAQAININNVQGLSGTRRDLQDSAYRFVKFQLASLREAIPRCRFLYLMGRRPDGKVFFFADSQPSSSQDYAPPGLIYDEVPEDYLRVFESRTESVVGPVTDRWGTLVTALIPLVDAGRGELAAVLGMDVEAGDWNREILTRCFFPFSAMVFFALLVLFTERRRAESRLRENEENLRITLDSIGDAVISTDLSGGIVRMNLLARKLTGWKIESARGRPLRDIFHVVDGRTGEPLDDPVGQVLQSGKKAELANHAKLLTSDGGQYQIADSVAPIRDGSGRITGAVLVFRDITEDYLIREQLRQNEELLDLAMSVKNEGLWDWDLVSGRIYFDSRYYHMSGYEAHEFPATLEEFEKRVHTADLDHVREEIQRYIKGERDEYLVEFRFQTKEQDWMWIMAQGEIVAWSEDGSPRRFVGTHTDITQRKKAEQEIREQAGFLQLLINSMPNQIFWKDRHLAYLGCNQSFAGVAGVGGPDEIVGLTDEELRQRSGYQDQYDYLDADILSSGQPALNIEESYRRPDGGEGTVLTSKIPIRDTAGQIIGLLGIRVDITARKQMEEEIRIFKKAVDSSSDAIGMARFDGKHYYQNQAFSEMFGSAGDDPPTTIYCDEKVGREVFGAIMSGREWSGEVAMRGREGRKMDVFLRAYSIKQGDRVIGLVGVHNDMTERKRTEETLRNIDRLQSVGTLAGGIAHDFNNILLGVFGNTSIARSFLDSDHPATAYLEEAEKSMERATLLTRQLLTFSKGGAPRKEDVDLGGLVKEVVRFDLSGSNVKPVFRIKEDLWPAQVDTGQIQQVISNLTINADQAMPDGGNLQVSLENVELADTTGLACPPGKYIRLIIRDEGEGVDSQYLNRIFDPYFSTKESGSGLGLAIVYSIIEKHGGCVDVASQAGQGTTFTIYLPASPARKDSLPESTGPEQKKRLSGLRVLVMDDEVIIRKVATHMLGQQGCHVETACDGREAVELYRKEAQSGNPFDLVILDLTVPGGMGGEEAVQELLALDPAARVVVSSGYARGEIQSRYQSYGFQAIIPKPYRLDNLLDTVHRVLAQPGPPGDHDTPEGL